MIVGDASVFGAGGVVSCGAGVAGATAVPAPASHAGGVVTTG
jgi:hypothetical protein